MMSERTAPPSSVGDYFAALRRRYIYFATVVPLALFVCVVAAFAIHPLYQATATIMLEPSSVPKDIIETTVISYSDQQVEIVQGRVMTAAGLAPVIKQVDPYPKDKSLSDAQKAQRILDNTSIERVDPVTLKPQAESNAFSLHYNNPDPEIAAAVTNRLAQLFLTYNQVRRSEAAGEATGFLQKQSEDFARQMRDVDAQLALLKSKYGEATPEFMMRNQAIIEDTQRQLDNLQQQILTAQEKESELSLQLSGMSPNLITQSGDLTDVATVRAKLTEAEQRYTPDHPEVKRLKRALETLMAQSGAAAGSKVPPNNPQYLMTHTELMGARNSLASLQRLDGSLRAKLERSRGLVLGTPAAEKEFSAVLRRKEVLQNEYQRIQDRLQSANLAETFESAQGGERFTLVHAPSVPKLPVYPNRIGLILLGLVFGSALAGVGAALAESSDKRVRTARDVILPDGVPMLASIPFINNKSDRRRRAIMLTSFVAAYGLAIFVAAAVIVSSRFQ
jgi:polysaccharide chain length determinant protein (PEP-CTERM system associated)